MSFFKNNLDSVSFFAEFDKKLSKTEHNFFVYLLENFEKQKNDNFIILKKDVIMEKLELSNYYSVIEELNKLAQKHVKYTFKDKNKEEEGFFSPIYSLRQIGLNYYFAIAQELRDSYGKNNIFNYYHLSTLVKFRLPYTIKLYQELFRYFDKDTEFEILVEDLRKLFQMTDSYERFYDFEKNVLEQVIEDINEHSDYRISYEKIKENDGKTNKIRAIRLEFFSKRAEKIQKDANKLLTLIKEYVEDFDNVLTSIKKYLDLYDYKYVKENIYFALQHKEGEFDKFLIEALEKNYISSYFEAKTKNVEATYKLLVDMDKYYSSIFKLETDLYKELSQLKFYYEHEFVALLHNLKVTNKIEYSDERIKIFVEFNKQGNSHIKIYGVE